MKLALYARVSRDDLFNANQKATLLEWARRNDLKPEEFEYIEEQQTTRKTRPIKETIIKGFREGKYSGIVVVRIDRFARSLQELIGDIENIINQGGRFVAILNGFDFERRNYNASQQLTLSIFSAFAQFEREIIRERTLEGLARARAWGKKLGRPKGKESKKDVSTELVKKLQSEGKNISEISRLLLSTTYRITKAIKKIHKEKQGGISPQATEIKEPPV